MQLSILSYKNPNLLAAIFATLIHAGVGFYGISSSNPTVLNQQVIQVSFVAPSTQKYQSKDHLQKEDFLDLSQKNALKLQKKNNQNTAEIKSEKNLTEKKTSGRVDVNATALKSAESDPVFDASYLNNPAPSYPESAKRRGIQGKVLLNVIVKIDGSAAAVTVLNSSGSSILDEAAIEAVREWKFIPANRSGNVVQASVVVPIEFKII